MFTLQEFARELVGLAEIVAAIKQAEEDYQQPRRTRIWSYLLSLFGKGSVAPITALPSDEETAPPGPQLAPRKTQLRKKNSPRPSQGAPPSTPTKDRFGQPSDAPDSTGKSNAVLPPLPNEISDGEDESNHLLMNPAAMLPFSLPTFTDMIVSYGAGFGGLNRERERKYIPSVPPEFLAKLDLNGGRSNSTWEGRDWENEDI